MRSPAVDVLKAGANRPVLCLHSSLGSSRQWSALTQMMAPHARIIAPDLYGHGATPAWQGARNLRLDDELARLTPVIRCLGDSFDLVGHSYGAAVAAQLALRHPSRIRTLTLYEPVLFSILRQDEASQPAHAQIHQLRMDLEVAVSRGRTGQAAERFIDYWSGQGTWLSLSRERQHRYASGMPAVMQNFATADTDRTLLHHYQSLQVPVLLMRGESSPSSTQRIVELLSRTLPNADTRTLSGMGHMGPVTHPDRVNACIRSFQWTSCDLAIVA